MVFDGFSEGSLSRELKIIADIRTTATKRGRVFSVEKSHGRTENPEGENFRGGVVRSS